MDLVLFCGRWLRMVAKWKVCYSFAWSKGEEDEVRMEWTILCHVRCCCVGRGGSMNGKFLSATITTESERERRNVDEEEEALEGNYDTTTSVSQSLIEVKRCNSGGGG